MSAEREASRPDLSVVVVTHNGRRKALETLASAQAAQGWIDAEWFVVDAGSGDGTPDAIEARFPTVRVLRRENRGFAASNNVALERARGRYVLLLNPDVEFSSGNLAELVAAMDARPGTGIASVVQTDADGSLQPSIRRFPSVLRGIGEALFSYHWPLGRGLQEPVAPGPRYERAGDADWMSGAFLIARAEAVAEVGPLDERFFLYSEETDWCYRFKRAGWGVEHLPVATVVHHCGGGSDGVLKPQLTHSKMLFARKHYGRVRAAAIRGALALGHALRVFSGTVLGLFAGARHRERAAHEAAALKVALGAPPPYGPYAANAGAGVAAADPSPADLDDRELREERYRGRAEGRSRLMSAYYNVKPLLPRSLQLAMRRRYAVRQARVEFPRWPIEPILVERRQAALRAELEASGATALPTVATWPEGHRFAAILTHDVEGPKGVALVREIMAIEQRHGFRSSWNFVGDWYPIEAGLFDHVRAAGHEIGLHGIKHDCKLFESRANFEAELPEIHRKLREWDAVGFRAPATHRNADWMEELGAAYDSSFPDTDPFEPLGGGCCSILPFFLGEMVELPITLVQDHTLWEILRRDTIDLWTEKSDWIAANGGLVNLITHPDYLDTPARLRMYEEFLAHLAEMDGGWHALPRDVADWWRLRRDLGCVSDGPDAAHVVGPGSERARIEWVRADGAMVPTTADAVAAR
ncbi:MAG TPA: glycosyltransferase [Solirubrobacterales bacterium]|nr:glycosyltransferase [Solirubrobacterales bacterium]